MSLNGNRFKISPGRRPCPECHGYPLLVLTARRLVPTCATCAGDGTVPAGPPEPPPAA